MFSHTIMLLCNSFTECIGLCKALSRVLSSSFRMIDIIEVVTRALQLSFIQKPLIYFKNRACRVLHTLQESY